MRRLQARPELPVDLIARLDEKTALIIADTHPDQRAQTVFDNSRGTVWFGPVIAALSALAGPGSPCMFCSGGEASQVEHFRPKRAFPEIAMNWSNFTWCCGICNQNKGDRFPQTASGEFILNPLEDNVWLFYFVDEYGNLTEKWREDLDDFDPRALLTTCTLKLDRQALQERRQARLRSLVHHVDRIRLRLASDSITVAEARQTAQEWLSDPAQPDVTDYFVRGPGSLAEPFRELLTLIGPIE